MRQARGCPTRGTVLLVQRAAVARPYAPPVATVLVVDDDPTVLDVVERYLSRAGHTVLVAADGRQALEVVAARSPDLVVLDLMLPGLDGLEVCRQLRETTPVPVIVLSARGAETDRIVGLEVGADDYLAKPFSPRELVLRVQAVLRRSAPPMHPTAVLLRAGEVEVDRAARVARRSGRVLSLTVREFDLLVHLLENPLRVFTRQELLRDVWGWDFGDASTVTVHVRRLREKVEVDPSSPALVTTVRGVGYRLDPEPA